MSKKIVVIFVMMVFFSTLAVSQTDNTTINTFENLSLDNLGCVPLEEEEGYICPIQNPVYDVKASTLTSVECYSSNKSAKCSGEDCIEEMDIGCYGLIELKESKNVQICLDVVKESSSNRECENLTLLKGEKHFATINPDLIDFSMCSDTTKDDLYIMNCSYMKGKSMTFDGYKNLNVFTIVTTEKGFELGGFIQENIISIGLFLLIVLVVLWISYPKLEKKGIIKKIKGRGKNESK